MKDTGEIGGQPEHAGFGALDSGRLAAIDQGEPAIKVTYVTLPLPGGPVRVPIFSMPASAFTDLRGPGRQ